MARTRVRRYYRHGFLPQLLAFEACARLGSVTRAAEELSLAQPTVSGLLRKLSDTMGAPLLQPRNGRMELTEAGREAAFLCYEILAVLQRNLKERPPMTDPFGVAGRKWLTAQTMPADERETVDAAERETQIAAAIEKARAQPLRSARR